LARFASGGDAFTVSGLPLARDSLVVEGGVEFGLAQNASLGLSYGGQFGSNRSDHMVRASYDVRF
ncbi:outer membrane autotransporter protein, partial [Ciceribacter lividus]